MAPTSALYDAEYRSVLALRKVGYGVGVMAFLRHAANLLDVFGGHNRGALGVPPSGRRCSPSVLEIFQMSDPFKVAHHVVRAVTVDVVNERFVLGVRNKRDRNHAMDKNLLTPPAIGNVSAFAYNASTDSRTHVAILSFTTKAGSTRATNTAKGAGLVTRVTRYLAPFFIHTPGVSVTPCVSKG